MNTKTIRHCVRRVLVTLVSVGLIVGPLTQSAYGAPTPLADIPIASKVATKPNIVYTLDDSGSMQFNYLPDWVIGAASNVAISKITRAGTVATATVVSTAALVAGQFVTICCTVQPEYSGSFPIKAIASPTTFTYDIVGAPVTPATVAPFSYQLSTSYCRGGAATTTCSIGALSTFTSPPFYAADFNHLAYDPNVNYQPPPKYDGTPLTHTIGVDTDVFGNQIKLNNVQSDPFTAPANHSDLSVRVTVPLYCNTDWPPSSGGPASNLVLADVADPNGEYKAGSGAWCRINGTAYDASVASGAPAVLDDYNYPYQNSAAPAGTQYFYRAITLKTMYCDTTSPFYPHNLGAITGCTLGGTPTCGGLPCTPVTSQQKCNRSGFQCNTTVAARNFTPAVCKPPIVAPNSPATYCLPNVGGSDSFSTGTGTTPECAPCTCNADFQPNTGTCSITAAACTGPYGILGGDIAQCPDQTVTPAPNGCSVGVPIRAAPTLGTATCPAFTWDPVAGNSSNVSSPPGTTLLQDSNNLGVVCRHNNQVYAVSGAPAAGGPFIYPRTNLGDVYAANKAGPAPYTQTGAFTQAVTSGCPAVGPITIPRHYYTIDSVQFCDNLISLANDPWKGFGTGVCKPANDLTHFQNVKYGKFHRLDLVNDGRVFNYVDQATSLPASRTYAQEVINYGNWFAYYRLRSLAAKTSSALAFNNLDNTYRVGFHTLGSEPVPVGTGALSWVDVNDFNPGAGNQRNLWWNALFAVPTVTNYKTPSLSAMLRIGNLIETGGAGGLNASITPLPGGVKDPMKDASGKIVSCQSNYHILFTDGFTNQVYLPTVAGDADQAIPGYLPPEAPPDPDKVHAALNVALWPPPFRQGPKAVANTLSDVATYYWARDLRPGLKNDVPAWSGKPPNDADPAKDIAWWQHVQFSAISFGAAGTLDAQNQGDVTKPGTTLGDLTTGALSWPDLTAPNNPQLPAGNKGAVAVDDLWHAAVNARGQFVFATSPLEVQYGLGAILAGISNQRKSRSAAAFSGQVLSTSNDIIYEPTIEQGWGGDLLKVQIETDPTSVFPPPGAELATLWNAAAVLANQIKPAFLGDEPWFDESKRRIVTWNGAAKAAFRAVPGGTMATVLSNAQLNTLSLDPLTQKKMVAYLRGGTTFTVPNPVPPPPNVVLTIEGTGIGQFRKRIGGALGDLSNAQPLVVSAPSNNPIIFNTGADPGYVGYVATWNPDPTDPTKGRPDRIVAPANDGMVHVFDSADGHEIMAYVPSSLLRTTVDAAGKATGLQALTYQDGGVPLYRHHFYVDSSPRTADVDFNSAGVKGGASDWHTIVVGGMGKGGSSYYGLDLTLPNAVDESQAAAKLLWEFHDADWNYTYGHPVIVKTYAYGWTVIVTSGYNNVSGEGRIYFLNPKDGTQLRAPLTTGAISCTGPDGNPQTSGLTQINGFTKDFHNQFVEQLYGGDLCGNLWRFDLTSTTGAYPPAQLFAVLTDPAGKPQPITTAPQIEIDIANGVNRYVFIGTGRLLDVTDETLPATPQAQTLYAIRDGTLSKPIPDGDPSLPIRPRGGGAFTLVSVPAGGAPIAAGAPNGWYHDLPDGTGATPAERIVVDVEADVSAVTYIGTQVTNDPCTIALPANVYVRQFGTAESLISDPINGWFYHDDSGGVGGNVVGFQNPSTGEITLGVLLSHEIPGTHPVAIKNPVTVGRNRMSWRLLTGE